MPYPVGTDTVREFATGLEKIVVVEDKTAFIEAQIRDIPRVRGHSMVAILLVRGKLVPNDP